MTWCLGHLLEQAPPDAYDPAYKQWRLDHLPILPAHWQLAPRPKARGQLGVIRRLLKQAQEVVHAGDPDREGQLLVQEVIEYLGWKGPVSRLLVSDLNRPAVQRALVRLEDNARYQPLYRAAESRSRADWLYGINLTRAWTLTGRQAGHDGVLSVGRVQTPVLGLVVRRDAEIRDFTPTPSMCCGRTSGSPRASCAPGGSPARPTGSTPRGACWSAHRPRRWPTDCPAPRAGWSPSTAAASARRRRCRTRFPRCRWTPLAASASRPRRCWISASGSMNATS